MATLSLMDQMVPSEIARRFGNKDSIEMIEVLEQTNEMLMDAYTTQASDGTINRTVQRTTYATPSRRIYGQGIGSGASTSRAIEDGIVMIEQYSDVDADMADHAPSRQELLYSEDVGVLEKMAQVQAEAFIYDSSANGREYIDGFYARLPGTADNVSTFRVETSGSNLGSILLVKWAPDKTQVFYPRGMPGVGVQRFWRGLQDISILDSGVLKTLPVYRTFFKTHFGITMKHPYAVKRIANINPATLTANNGEAVAIKIMQAYNKLPKGRGTVVAYMSPDIITVLDAYTRITRTNYMFAKDDPWGRPTNYLFGGEVRVRRVDQMLCNEAAIS